jgi:hypothetical protein
MNELRVKKSMADWEEVRIAKEHAAIHTAVPIGCQPPEYPSLIAVNSLPLASGRGRSSEQRLQHCFQILCNLFACTYSHHPNLALLIDEHRRRNSSDGIKVFQL